MCQRQTRCFGCVEPSELVVLSGRGIYGFPKPLVDPPDPQDEFRLNDSAELGARLFDNYSQLFLQLAGQRLDGLLPALDMPTGEIPDVWIPAATGGAVAQQHTVIAHQ